MPIANVTASHLAFETPELGAALDALGADPAGYDALDFGLVAMDLAGTVLAYNELETQFAGVSARHAVGLVFFTDIAPCTNNYLVSGRFDEEAQLDETIDYVFTVKMRPKVVRLRLLKNERSERQYLAVKW